MKIIVCNIIIILFFFGCQKKGTRNNVAYDYVGIRYSDSTYSKPIDSFYVKNTDTLFFNKSFSVTGYFKIYNHNRHSYAVGQMNNNQKENKWLFYQKYLDNWIENEEHNYKEGILNGEFLIYDILTGRPISVYNYIKDEKVGKQVDYYLSGKLHIKYETDSIGAFINDYTVYNEDGRTLFNVELGQDGTGYIKFYNKDNQIEWEGSFINKKKEGLHKNYLIDTKNNQVISEERILYKRDSIISTTIVETNKTH